MSLPLIKIIDVRFVRQERLAFVVAEYWTSDVFPVQYDALLAGVAK